METPSLRFCAAAEAVAEVLSTFAAKALFVSDGGSLRIFSDVRHPRALFVVLDGPDVLPLFSMPDGVCVVLAAGRAETLLAARYFAEARRIPCLLFPSDPALDGVYGGGEVEVNGERFFCRPAEGQVVCDPAEMGPKLGEGYARILLARLALAEERAVSVLRERPRSALYEEGFAVFPVSDGEGIVRANAALRKLEGGGLPCGEGAFLVQSGRCCAWRAYAELLALYCAFFRAGKPRRYLIPDYAARSAAAGVAYTAQEIPSPEQYARRAILLERMRGEFWRGLLPMLRTKREDHAAVRRLGGETQDGTPLHVLDLPERRPAGLSALIRDFGLLEQL